MLIFIADTAVPGVSSLNRAKLPGTVRSLDWRRGYLDFDGDVTQLTRGANEDASMYSVGLTFDLKPGCYDEYKKAHDDLWPEIAASMSDNDVSMVIYRFENQLFLCATAPSEADWAKSREHPALAKWSDYMSQLIVSDGDGQLIFHEMEEAFAFGKFSQGL